jgi:serine/threonine-protein kinase
VDPDLERLCMKALAPNAEDRIASAADFQSQLDAIVAEKPQLRANHRELGRFVAEAFSAERAKIKSLVEAQLGRAKAGEITDLSAYVGSGSASGVGAARSNPSSVSGTLPSASEGAPRSAAPRLVLLGGVALIAIAAIVGVTMRSRQPEAKGSTPTAQARLTVRVTPADATVTLDGVPLAGRPPSGQFPLGAEGHRVRAEAPGYTSEEQVVQLDSSLVDLDMTLRRLSAVNNAVDDDASVAPNKPAPVGASPSRTSTAAPARTAGPSVATAPTATTVPSPLAIVPAPTAVAPPPSATTKGPTLDKSDPWASPAKP